MSAGLANGVSVVRGTAGIKKRLDYQMEVIYGYKYSVRIRNE